MVRINKAAGLENPLQNVFPQPIVSNRAPTANDRRYAIGQEWIDQSSNQVYILTEVSAGAATWTITGPGDSDVDTLTGDTGGAISPAGGNINIIGGDGLSVAGAGSTLTINRDSEGGYPITQFVVGVSGEAGYTTIQAALDAANTAGGGVVYIQPGTYTEDLTLYDGVDLYGTPAVSQNQGATVSLIGTHTPPASGHIGFNSIYFQDTSAIFQSAVAGSTHIVLLNCESAVQNGHFFDLENWTGIFEIWDHNPDAAGAPFAVDDGGINNTGGATLFMFAAGFGSGTTNTMVLSGTTVVGEADISSPVDFQTGAILDLAVVQFSQPVTFSNDSTGTISYGEFQGGATAAITMSSSGAIDMSICTVDSTNDPAIAGAGAGTLKITDVAFVNNSNISGTLTLDNGISRGGNSVTRFTVGASPDAGYTTIQAALDAANTAGGGTVYIQPGTYTEDLTLYSDVFIVNTAYQGVGAAAAPVRIIGTHTPPTTGQMSVNEVRFESATDIFNSAAAGSAQISIQGCVMAVTNGYTFNLPNWTGAINCNDCGSDGTNDGFFNNSGGASIFTNNGQFGAGTLNAFTANGDTRFDLTFLDCPCNITGGTIFHNFALFSQTLTLTGTASGTIVLGNFFTGATPAIDHQSSGTVVLATTSIDSTNNPALDGTGTFTLESVSFAENATLGASLTVTTGSTIVNDVFSTVVGASGTTLSGTDITAAGTDANITLDITPKGTGTLDVNASLRLPSAGTQLQLEGGAATDFIGQATLVAGTVTVANTNIAATDKVLVTREGVGASTDLGILDVSIIAATSFTITSLQSATPGSTETGDLSVVNYFIVREL